MDNTRKASNPGRKTNNSQSAGMKGTSSTPASGTTNMPHRKEAILETNTQNMFTPGTPDMPEVLDIPETSSFQTA